MLGTFVRRSMTNVQEYKMEYKMEYGRHMSKMKHDQSRYSHISKMEHDQCKVARYISRDSSRQPLYKFSVPSCGYRWGVVM